MRPLAVLLALLAAVLVAAGCGETTIDDAKAEEFISTTVSDQVGARVESVACPDDLVAEQGETFECTVTGDDGSSGRATVTQKDDEGNVSVSAPFIHVRDLEEQIATGIAEQIGSEDVALDCPEIIVGEKGDSFECEATSGDDTATVAVTQTDDQGNVRYELQ